MDKQDNHEYANGASCFEFLGLIPEELLDFTRTARTVALIVLPHFSFVRVCS
jgi:hypothetical protein